MEPKIDESNESIDYIYELASHYKTALEKCIKLDSVLRDMFISLAHDSIIADMATSQK